MDDQKVNIDLALWEITLASTAATGNSYQFKNKKTKTVLSFEKSLDAKPILSAEGVSEWSFPATGVGSIQSQLSSDKTMTLFIKETKDEKDNDVYEIVFSKPAESTDIKNAEFRVLEPGEKILEASELGNGFSTFQLSFGETIEGDIFSGKDLVAVTTSGDITAPEGYFLLQEKGNEAYSDETKKFFGIDTLKIDGASNSFALDSIRETIKPNLTSKFFKFTADLKNDSLTMIVKGIPSETDKEETKADGDTDTESSAGEPTDVKVVYAQLGTKKVLTINNTGIKNYPCITSSRGVPAEIKGGTGVYFLKSASKTATGGKYISAYGEDNKIVTMSGTPSVNSLEGQWYIKEDGRMYSIVDRKTNTSLLLKGEVFAVQGMDNTFTFGGSADSITVEA
ncbi:MAG: hypothetical protein LUD46_22950 [Parabacteroides sp.]|nr:hypothetical protein [Parabacteroides sp.]